MFFTYLFNIYGISTIGASAAGSYINTQPIFAAIIAMMLRGETYDWLKLLAAVLIFSGVHMVNRKPKAIGYFLDSRKTKILFQQF